MALTFWTQHRDKQRVSASKVSTWYTEKEVSGKCYIQNNNDFPVYNVISFVAPNQMKLKNPKKIFSYLLNEEKSLSDNMQLSVDQINQDKGKLIKSKWSNNLNVKKITVAINIMK